jgi:hypothetical protein
MTTYTDAFGSETIPPSEYQYRAVALDADVTLGFPSVSEGEDVLSSIMDVTASAGPFTITLPDATNGSNGQDVLIRNVGAESFEVDDSAGGAIATIAAGEVKYIYLTDNSTPAGVWAVFTFGTGTSGADASALAGQGLAALASKLVSSANVNVASSTATMTAEDSRAEVYVFNGGSVDAVLPTVVTAGNGWFVDVSNMGTGTITITNTDGALIDGASSKPLSPTESCRLYTDGAAWYSIGFGRSVDFVFTKLVKDITAGTPFTLTSAEASNKLLQFIGAPSSNVVVNIPTVVSIYYVQCSYTGAYTLEIKTSAGTGVTLQNTDRTILYCDGVNVVAAQTVAAGSNISVVDGSASSPAINFSADTDTGFYRAGTNSLGVAAGGVQSATFTATGINDTPVGATTRSTGAFTTMALTTPLAVTSGGTGYASYALGDLIFAGTTTSFSRLTAVATGNALLSGGVSTGPAWGKIGLTTHVSGILPIANGGTGSSTSAGAAFALKAANADITSLSAVTGLGNGSNGHINIDTAGFVSMGAASTNQYRLRAFTTTSDTALTEAALNGNTQAANTSGVALKMGILATCATTTGYAGTGNLYGGYLQSTHTLSTTISNLIGAQSIVANTGSGTVTSAVGFSAQLSNTGGGVFTQYIGYLAADGTANTYYGFYSNVNSGASKYSFFSGGTARSAFNGNIEIISNTALLGYGTGAGGTVTQLTSKGTAVTLNRPTGEITLNNSALAAATSTAFVVNNSVVTSNADFVGVNIIDSISSNLAYQVTISNVTTGSFTVHVRNVSAGSLSDAIKIKFQVFKGVSS